MHRQNTFRKTLQNIEERERERVRVEESETKCIFNHSDGFVLRPKWSGTGNTFSRCSLQFSRSPLAPLSCRLHVRDLCPS